MLRWSFVKKRVGIRSLSVEATLRGVSIDEALLRPKPETKPGSKRTHQDGPAQPRPTRLITKSLAELSRATRSRHLLRSILRECTYLPDAFARQWTSQHAISRFRSYDFKSWKHRKVDSFKDRLIRKEREARQSLASLRRANEGERKCLLKVLLMAYGRVGRRRHELMVPLLSLKAKPSGKMLSDHALVPGESAAEVPYVMEPHDLDLTPQLRALVKSQMKVGPPALTRRNPRRADPVIPELNNWLRPMPQKRVKNMKQKHYAYLLERIQPSLPKEDWVRLLRLASGCSPLEKPRARRAAPRTASGQVVAESALDMVVQYGRVPNKVFKSHDAHAITPRFMRRLYAEVFSQCPLMELQEGTDEWKVTWGSRLLAENDTSLRDDVPAGASLPRQVFQET